MVFALRTKAARDTVIKEFEATNYGVVNPHTIDDVTRLFSSSVFFSHLFAALRVAV